MALETSPERPAPVRVISQAIGSWISRLGAVWVEGQIAQLTRRPGAATVFLTLRDPAADLSLQVTCPRQVFDALEPPVGEGARVVLHARPTWYYPRGTLSLSASEIRQVGIGELLARLEQLKRVLAAEGVFDAERKRKLPFLPNVVGLICGRGSAAEHDVLENGRKRWPVVRFRVENVPVQGPYAVPEIIDALRRLDTDGNVDVIIVARGGGSVEDLLPFSDEALIRAVAACRTPVVSAIGHETDTPLLDLVADVRASTPTDAAKRIVPDLAAELAGLGQARDRLRAAIQARLHHERALVAGLRSRPVLAEPGQGLARRSEEISALRDRTHRAVIHRLDRDGVDLEHTLARIRALSPAATLDRGYAIVQRHPQGSIVRRPDDVSMGERLSIRLAEGSIATEVVEP